MPGEEDRQAVHRAIFDELAVGVSSESTRARFRSIIDSLVAEGAEGIILESVLEGYAEYYSADLSEKVVRGMTDNALKCKFNGGTMPIGYVIDAEQHFRIDPLTAPFAPSQKASSCRSSCRTFSA